MDESGREGEEKNVTSCAVSLFQKYNKLREEGDRKIHTLVLSLTHTHTNSNK